MPTITLQDGDVLEILIEGTDHAFEVHANSEEYEGSVTVVETGGISGSDAGEAEEILYQDAVEQADEEDEEDEEGDDEETEEDEDGLEAEGESDDIEGSGEEEQK